VKIVIELTEDELDAVAGGAASASASSMASASGPNVSVTGFVQVGTTPSTFSFGVGAGVMPGGTLAISGTGMVS
jgi:hypothetical protein